MFCSESKEIWDIANQPSGALWDNFSRGHVHMHARSLSSHLSMNPHMHAQTQWPTLKSEQTSVWSGLLKIDKSLTSVSGAQAAYVGRPLDIWQTDRALFPTCSDIREYASQTSNCLKVRELLTARYRGQLSLPYDLCGASRPKVILPALSLNNKKKNICSAHRGYETNVTKRIAMGNFTVGLPCPRLHQQTKILDKTF